MFGIALPGHGAAQALPGNGVGTQFELAFWQSVDNSGDPSLYEAYLQRYPYGTFADLARAKIAALRSRGQGSAPVQQPPPQPAYSPPSPPVPPAAPLTGAAAIVAQPPQAVVPPPQVMAPPPPVVQAPQSYPPPPPPPAVAQEAATQPTPAAAAPPAGQSTLGQLLAELAGSQNTATSGQTGGVASASQQQAPGAGGQPASPPPGATSALSAGFALPPQPVLVGVPTVTMPPSFCSGEARNTFHDRTYVAAIDAAKRNNDNAVGYMKQLQSLYDQYQLTNDPNTMNAIANAAHNYQPVAQSTFATQAALVHQFDLLMAVPIVPCAQTLSQPSQ